MAKFRKKILLENREYHSPDGVVKVDANRLNHWQDNFAKFRESNIKIPVFWGHSDDPKDRKPVEGKKRAPSDSVGYLTDFTVSPDGGAEIELDIRRPADVEKVEANLAEVSPVIFDRFVDGKKNEYGDVIGGMDLVHYPVDSTQSEFTQDAIACSIRMGLDSGNPQTYRMAMDEEKDFPPADEDETLETPDEETAEAIEDEQPIDEEDITGQLVAALAKLNVILSPNTDRDNFQEHLLQALLTLAAQDGMGGEASQMEDTAPEIAAMALKTDPYAKYADKQHQASVKQKLEHLLESGRCTPAEAKAKNEALGTVRLSLDPEGNHVPTSVEEWIESRQAVPSGTFWTSEQRTRMSRLEDTKHPTSLTGDISDEEADEIVDAVFKRN